MSNAINWVLICCPSTSITLSFVVGCIVVSQTKPCDVIDTFELLIDRAYELQQQYDRGNDEVLYKLEIERVQNKMNDLEKFLGKIDWELEDYKNCSNFEEVN